MSEMPARIWAEDTRDGEWFGHPRSAYAVEYIRADITERMADALDNLLAASERHIFSTECQKEREAARSALSAWKDGR